MPEPAKILQFPQSPESRETPALVDRAAWLKETIAIMTDELRGLNLELARRGEFKPGSKTGHAFGLSYKAKIQLKEYQKWDQPALNTARSAMGDAEFFRVFDWEFKPKSAKTLAGALEFGQHAPLIRAALTVSIGAPQVSFEKLEDC